LAKPYAPKTHMVSHVDNFVAKITLDERTERNLESVNPDLRHEARDLVCKLFRDEVEATLGLPWRKTGPHFVTWTEIVSIRKLSQEEE